MGNIKEQNEIGKQNKVNEIFTWVQDKTIFLYTVFIFGVFPLVLHDGFFDITETKFRFAVYGIILTVVVYAVCGILKWEKPELSCWRWWDIFLPLFLAFGAVGVWTSEYGTEAFMGEKGRYYGLFLFLLYGAICVVIVSNGICHWGGILLLEISGVGVAVLGILNHYQIDPVHTFDLMLEEEKPIFTSTMGNINTQGMFLGILFALSAGQLTYSGKWYQKLFHGGVCGITALGLATNNADGGFLGVIAFFALGWMLLSGWDELMRYLTAGLLFFAAVLLAGRMEQCFAGRSPLEGISAYLAGAGWCVWALAALLLCMAAAFGLRNHKKAGRMAKRAAAVVFGIVVLSVLIAFGMANWGSPQLAENAGVDFLSITDDWGSNRGYIWRKTIEEFWSLPLEKKMIGTGPDTTCQVYQQICTEAFIVEGNRYYIHAHSEYLQFLLCHGILGTVCWFGWLFGSVWQMIKTGCHCRRYNALALAVSSYLALCLVNCSLINCSAVVISLLCLGKCKNNVKSNII